MSGLALGSDLVVPEQYALEKVAILATTGAGKSNAAVVIAEELFAAGIPWVAVDPKGDWWGVRSSGAGDAPGLPVPVFGGEHGDLPLEPTAGPIIARAVAEQRLSCVVDVSDFDTRAQMFRFLEGFATTLLRLNRRPLHVFAEECDDYIPQTTGKEGGDRARCLGAWQRLIKRGRQKGIGATLISQRASTVNKDALNMAQTLLALRVTGPRDIEAVREWMVGPTARKGLSEEEAAMLQSLRGLQAGEAWLWSPHWLQRYERVAFRRRWTFDSGATPELGDEPIEPTALADIDLDALGAEITATRERAKQDDPDELRRQIAGLHAEVRALQDVPPAPPPEREVVRVLHVPPAMIAALHEFPDAVRSLVSGIADALERESGTLAAAAERITAEAQVAAREAAEAMARAPIPAPPAPRAAPPRPRAPSGSSEAPSLDGENAPARVLATLARFPEGLPRRRLAAYAGIAARKSTLRNALSELRQAGLIQSSGDLVVLTVEGAASAARIPPLPSGPSLLDHWRGHLGGGAPRELFEALVASWPAELSRAEVAAIAAIDPETSTLRNALSRLRSLDLIDERGGMVSASRDLMEAAR